MPTVAVYDIANQQVGDIELNENIFGVGPQALEAEGYRPCTQWFHPFPNLGRWRYRIRSISTLLLLQHASQAASPCTQVRPV